MTIAQQPLSKYLEGTGASNISQALFDSIHGINHRKLGIPVPVNRDNGGLTFFVRPDLNLGPNNIANHRVFQALLTEDPNNLYTAIRCLLDPSLAFSKRDDGVSVRSPAVDYKFAFIPILTNHLTTITGWPDQKSQFYKTKEGRVGEVHMHVDSVAEFNGEYTLSATFKNSLGNFILKMMYYWIHYQSKVYEGYIKPYPRNELHNVIDYNTRIFRVMTDPYNKHVTSITSTIASFVSSNPLGALFNYNKDDVHVKGMEDITIDFNCIGFTQLDTIVVREFNDVVCGFNSSMKDRLRSKTMTKIPYQYLKFFNFKGYPRIDIKTMELEWWVDASTVPANFSDLGV